MADVMRDPRVLLAACLLHPLPVALATAIKEVLATAPPQQAEPVAEVFVRRDGVAFAFWLHVPPPAGTKLFTAPPQRPIAPAQQAEPVQRKPLTETEIEIMHSAVGNS